MIKRLILTSQKNDVLDLIKNSNLDPFNFKWSEADSRFSKSRAGYSAGVSLLKYEKTQFYFKFDFGTEGHYAIFSPGEDQVVEERNTGDWANQREYAIRWLSYLKREVEQPDLWEELAKYQLPPGEKISPDVTNEPFTVHQIEQISAGIINIRAYLEVEFDLENQKDTVNEKLEYLIDAAKRQGRKDWFHTSIGVIFSLAIALSMSPEQARTIWNFLKDAVVGIIQFLPK